MPPDMSTRWEPPTAKAFEMLRWEWQPLDDVVREAGKLIMSGAALRKYQSLQESRIKRNGESSVNRRQLTQAEQIASGRRNLAMASIRTHLVSGRAETTEVDGKRLIRLARQVAHDGNCAGCGRPFQETMPQSQGQHQSTEPGDATMIPMTAGNVTNLQEWMQRRTS